MSGTFLTEFPVSRVPDPALAPPLRWGVLGPGLVASLFLASVQANTTQQIVAVASRNIDRAQAFATRFGVGRSHGSYTELVSDPEVDAIYIATPHTVHHQCAVLALEAGKHVLIEKPLALTVADATDIARRAEQHGLFCMEALWTLFLPKFDVIRQILDSEVLGHVTTVLADMGEWFPPDDRVMDPALAGGTLGDLGPYPVGFATFVLGAPETVRAFGQLTGGVESQVSAVLTNATGDQAVLSTSVLTNTPNCATIAGTQGSLYLDGPFYMPGKFTYVSVDKSVELIWDEPPVRHNALHFQVAEMARQITAGSIESPIRPMAATVVDVAVIEEIRRQVGTIQPSGR